MDDERSAVFGENVLVPSIEKDGTVHLPHGFRIIPGRGPNETMVRSLITPVEEMVWKSVFQAPQCFNASCDVVHGDPFAEVMEQPVAEGFEPDGGEHDFYVVLLCQRQDLRED